MLLAPGYNDLDRKTDFSIKDALDVSLAVFVMQIVGCNTVYSKFLVICATFVWISL